VSKDITQILAGWEHEPDQVTVRIVMGDDGREKIQLRLDLGLLQLEFDGRPDGRRPEGRESWLDVYEQRAAAAVAAGQAFQLAREDCEQLLREGLQYYHRYLSFWNLGRYDLCARDTRRNLRLFAFVRQHAPDEREKMQFDQWRPYVLMMHARAVAAPRLETRDYVGALEAVDAGIEQIQAFLSEYRQTNRANQCEELGILQKLRSDVLGQQQRHAAAGHIDTLGRLRNELKEAVDEERFEEAARLRDEIRRRSAS
jgi:hypothetical protein